MTEQDLLAELNEARAAGFTGYCGARIERAHDGFCRVSCRIQARHLNPHGMAHGGAVFTLMDTAAGVAGTTTGGEIRKVVTQCADVHFLRPVKPGNLHAEGTVIKSGRQTALVTVNALDDDGVLHAYGTFEIFYIDRT